jgi:HAD superfamily hydrolase (TIGR01509 family)
MTKNEPNTSQRALLFDLDGTLRDSRAAINAAVEHTLRQHLGTVPPWNHVVPHIHGLFAVHANLAPHIPFEQFHATYDKKIDTLRDTVTVYEDVIPTLAGLHAAGWLLGVASSSRIVDAWLQANKLDLFFDATVSSLEVANPKPHPESIMLALQKLGVEVSKAVMIGDLPVDIMAGKAAGVATVGITHGFGSRESLEAAGADYVADNLAEVLEVIEGL